MIEKVKKMCLLDLVDEEKRMIDIVDCLNKHIEQIEGREVGVSDREIACLKTLGRALEQYEETLNERFKEVQKELNLG